MQNTQRHNARLSPGPMTTIAALRTPSGVYVAWDSGLSVGDAAEVSRDPKVWRKDGYLIGAAGDLAYLNAIQYAKLPRAGKDMHRWAFTKLRPAVQKALEAADLKAKYGTLLVAARGEILTLDGSLSVARVERPYAAIGSGGEAALCALHALLASRKPSKAVLMTAVDATCAHLSGVMPPIHCEVAP